MGAAYGAEFWLTAVFEDRVYPTVVSPPATYVRRTPKLIAGGACSRCGALVVDKAQHDKWHEEVR